MRLFSAVFLLLFFVLAPVGWQTYAADQSLTHSTDFARVAPAHWRAEGWRVENPDPGAMIVEVDGVLAFVVTEPNRAMAWTLTTEPLWTDPFATLAVAFFVEGGVPTEAPPPFGLFDGSTGPITPGATNAENPLASGGRFECGTFTPGLHVEAIDLSAAENLDRVAEITITVRSGDEPVVLRLNQLTFLARGPAMGKDPIPAWVPLSDDTPDYSPLALPQGGAVSPSELEKHLGIGPDWWRADGGKIGGLPFLWGGHGVATPLQERGGVVLAASGTGNTLALLCANRLWGSGLAWYSKNYVPIRWNAPHPDQFVVRLNYGDGTEVQVLPQRRDKGQGGMRAGVGVYTVTLDPDRELVSARLEEGMSFGQVVLLAASRLDLPEVDVAPADTPLETPESTFTPAPPEGVFTVEGERIRILLDKAGMLHSLQLGADRREIATAPFPLLSLIDPDGNALPLNFVEALAVPERDRLVLLWDVGDGRRCEFSMQIREDGGLECAATLSNRGTLPWSLVGVLPRLTGLSIGPEPSYVLGGRNALLDSAPIDTAEIYGGQYPNQFMDLYDGAGGGLAYIVLDDTLKRKWFEFKLDDAGRANMAVSYRRLEVAPGERHSLPPVLLLPHEGDWRMPFKAYRDWVRRTFPRTRENSLADVFYCRRDYPLGGTSYLYDAGKGAYSPEKLISESKWAFGGVDMIDISGWAYNEAVGRVGTYRENDLGGLDGLAKGVWTAHAGRVQMGLYFEGYLLDKRAARAKEGLGDWQLIREDGEPAWWSGEMEFFCCPGATGWQYALAGDIAAVAEKTKADAVYVDQLGICGIDKECWSPKHGHPVPSNPIETEIALLKRIRAELDKVRPTCAIYIEHIPCDAMTPYIDGAFNLGMKQTQHPQGPTKLPLHRYAHPEVPVFEMVAHGIRPIPAEEDDLKLAFFHGMGLWLKGKGASWYSQGFRERAAALYPIYGKFGKYFRSPDAEPHVDTLIKGVYANRFPLEGNTLYTLYNSNSESVSGLLLELPDSDGFAITSLVDGVTLTLDITVEGTRLVGSIPPQGVAGVVLVRGGFNSELTIVK